MISVRQSAAVSHVGRIRSNNQDSGYAGQGLFVVADGMGGHAGGDVASAIATVRITEADVPYANPAEAEAALQSSLVAANSLITETVFEHAELTGMGTTVSAIIVLDHQVAIAHIGDSRIYLLREGELSQVTVDHTFVQRLVDSGRITEDEAKVHPRRSVLMRVLGDVEAAPEIDTMILGAQDGDRWLLCSDGLSGVVEDDEIHALLATPGPLKPIGERLVRKTLDGGAPDNVTVVLVEIGDDTGRAESPRTVGSAANPLAFGTPEPARVKSLRLPSLRLHPAREAHFEPDSEDYLDELIAEDERRARRRKISWLTGISLTIAAIVLAIVLSYQWTQTRYFVGSDGGTVIVYQGIQQNVGPISLSTVYLDTGLDMADLRFYDRQRVQETISADSLTDALRIVDRLKNDH